MIPLLLLSIAFPTGPLGLLFKIAIACVIVWGIYAIIKWLGWPIIEPVRIIFIVIVSIVILYWLFELLMMVI
jgi:hypothetical protein